MSNKNGMSVERHAQMYIEDGKMGMGLEMDSSNMGRPLVSQSGILYGD